MYDLVVLGGGPGGPDVARAAAAVGARVALIEAKRPRGDCTFSAGVPRMALTHAADLAHRIRLADRFGITAAPPEVDFGAVLGRVRAVVSSFAESDVEAMRSRGIEVFHGQPAFEAYDTVVVDGGTRMNGRAFVIATGSRPALPPIDGLSAAGPLTSETVWTLNTRPGSLAIIGAGSVGVETAQAMNRLGVEVTLIEASPRILPAEDPEVSDRLRVALEAEGVKIFTDAEISRVEQRDGKKVVHFSDRATGQPFEAARDALLVVAGRLANVESLNLGAIGIEADPGRGIAVDEYLQTYARNIYAIGDVIGHHQWPHAADREAAIVFQNAVLRIPKKIDYAAMPWATHTDPEVATVGRTHGFDPAEQVRTFRVEYEGLARARIEGRTQGFAKVVTTTSGKVLGATILGDDASLVLQEFVFAMEHGLTLHQVLDTAHPCPSHAGLARALASQLAAARLGRGITRAALKLVYGFEPRTGAVAPDGPVTADEGPVIAGANGQGRGH